MNIGQWVKFYNAEGMQRTAGGVFTSRVLARDPANRTVLLDGVPADIIKGDVVKFIGDDTSHAYRATIEAVDGVTITLTEWPTAPDETKTVQWELGCSKCEYAAPMNTVVEPTCPECGAALIDRVKK